MVKRGCLVTQQDCIYALAAYAQEALAGREVTAAVRAENEQLKKEIAELRKPKTTRKKKA